MTAFFCTTLSFFFLELTDETYSHECSLVVLIHVAYYLELVM